MTFNQYDTRLAQLINDSAERATTRIVVPTVNELLAKIKNRIIQKGENSIGGKIGNYGTNPAYYSKNQFVKQSSFKPQGKTGKRTISTMYLPAGYKQLRQIQGRESSQVNLQYTGSTLLSYQLQALPKYVVIGFLSKEASQIRQANEKKYGKVFYATNEEMKDYTKQVVTETEKLTTSILNA